MDLSQDIKKKTALNLNIKAISSSPSSGDGQMKLVFLKSRFQYFSVAILRPKV